MAHLSRRRRRGRLEWIVKWYDAYKAAGEEGLTTVSCLKKKATNETKRNKLLREYQEKEDDRRREVAQQYQGGRPRYDSPLADLIDAFLKELDDRVETRKEVGGRSGMSPGTKREYDGTLKLFREHTQRLTCGDVDAEVIRGFKHKLETGKGANGRRRSATTVNKHLRQLKVFLYRYGDANPPYFRDIPERLFRKALASVPVDRKLPVVYEPAVLQRLWKAALDHDAVPCEVTRESKDAGKAWEGDLPGRFVPLFPLFAMLTLTGARTHELLHLTWDDVDLDGGAITIRSIKTGRERCLPLEGERSGDISPGLLELLQVWHLRRVSPLVLPHPLSPEPVWPKLPWEKLRRDAELEGVTAKGLRSTWTSYLCSMGWQSNLVAWFAGHSPLVLHKHYADYARLRLEGSTLDEAMGLTDLIKRAVSEYREGTGAGLPRVTRRGAT